MHDILHERFGRDIAELVKDITQVRRFRRPESKFSRVPWPWISATAAGALALSLLFHASGLPRLWTPPATASIVETQPKSLGSESRGWLGVKIQNIDEDTAASLGLAEPKGALLTEVITPGPAAEAGLKNGDTILSVNGNAVADARDLARQISGFPPNTKADVHIIRGQKEQSIAVKLGKIPKEVARIESDEYSKLEPLWIEMKLGLKVALFTDADKVGVAVTGVDNSSDAAQKGIKTSDVILGVGDLPVRNLTSPTASRKPRSSAVGRC